MDAVKFKKIFKILLVNIILLTFLLEFTALIAIEGFQLTRLPIFRVQTTNNTPMVVDIDSLFGAWHYPNSSYRHIAPCFDVRYFFNSNGARDKEREREVKKNRVLMIGDSFVEGYGVDTSGRISNVLENLLDVEVLNFGVSGFSPTQMTLLYEKFGNAFNHNIVITSFFPSNDFRDNNIKHGKKNRYADRFRPYLVKTRDSLQLQYHVKSVTESAWHPSKLGANKLSPGENYPNTLKGKIQSFLRHFSYFYQILNYIKAKMNQESKHLDSFNSKHQFFKPSEIEILFKNFEQIKALANGFNAKVLLFVIPSLHDVRYFKNSKNAEDKLHEVLEKYCKDKGIIYVNLLKYFTELDKPESLYLTCDGHWSEKGHRLASEILFSFIQSDSTLYKN